MIFLGADLSTKRIDLAGVTPDGDWCFATIPVTQHTVTGRHLRDDIRQHLGTNDWDNVACLWIEEPFAGRNLRTYGQLQALKGAFAACVPPTVTVDTIRPATWRQEVGIPANGKRDHVKQAALAWAHTHLPADAHQALTTDLAEAACIAWTCLQQSTKAAAA